MKSSMKSLVMLPACIITVTCLIVIAVYGSKAISVIAENIAPERNQIIVIDAGHGGIDGGAVSSSGVRESDINLEIALKLNDLCRLLGMETSLIRTTDISVYTSGDTISQKKVSDLKRRVEIVNSYDNAILVSIHQNNFSVSKYSGAQVFYAPDYISKEIAETIQSAFVNSINKGSKRLSKKADGIYLMQRIHCPGILIECGFLSNPKEEAALISADYQKKICCVIAATLSAYLAS